MKATPEEPERPAPPPPLEADDQLVIRVITAGWAVALVVLLIVRGSLPAGQRWWVWTCVCGLVLGFFGLWYVPRLKRTRTQVAATRAEQAQQQAQQQAQSAPRDSGSNTVSSTDTPGRSTRS